MTELVFYALCVLAVIAGWYAGKAFCDWLDI